MKTKYIFLDILFILIGSFIYALSVNIFTAPNNIAPGGLTGVGTMINYLSGIPIGTVILLLNIPIFIWAYREYGFLYIGKTLFATVATSVMIDITAPMLPQYNGEILPVLLLGGLLSGIGLSLIFMRGATTGGTDLIAKLVMKNFPLLTLGKLILILDFIVVIFSAILYQSIEAPVYAMIVIFIMTKVIDGVLYGSALGNEKLLFIISKDNDIIAKRILSEIDRGVTEISAKGVYSNSEYRVLMCAVKRQEVYTVRDLVYSQDKNAFVIVTNVDDVIGEGFNTAE